MTVARVSARVCGQEQPRRRLPPSGRAPGTPQSGIMVSMRLRSRIRIIRNAYWPALLGLMATLAIFGTVGEVSTGILVGLVGASGVGLTLAWHPLRRWLMDHALAKPCTQLTAALDQGDDEALHRLHQEIEEYYRYGLASKQQLERLRGSRLAGEERWSEARSALNQRARFSNTSCSRIDADLASIVWGASPPRRAELVEPPRGRSPGRRGL